MPLGGGVANPPGDVQQGCFEVMKRMEELYPVLQRASGQGAPGGVSGAGAALQQSFVAYTYSFSDNPAVLQQMNSGQFNPAIHVDLAKWAQAVQNNPAPGCCYPEPLVGLAALEARIGQQHRAVEEIKSRLEELRQKFGNLKDHQQAASLLRLEQCRQRHQQLSRQLLQVVSGVEQQAVANGAARRSPHLEAQLEDRFARLEEVVQAPASARARLEEMWVVLRGLLQRGPPSGGAARLADADAEKTLRLTAAQGELLEQLQEEVARRKRDIAQFESALARFTASAAPAAQAI